VVVLWTDSISCDTDMTARCMCSL